jgi:nucleotide-binding universal stress UspA family protein
MYDTILIPYDGTEEARKGAAHGLELAAALDSAVHGLYVISLPGAPRALSIRDDEEEMRTQYREYGENCMAELEQMAGEHGVETTATTIRTGSVSDEIIGCAEEEEVDAIVMGSAYRGKLGNLLGGTTDKVVRSAPVPVITQRMHVDEV